MSDIKLTCDETPLAWPASVDISDLNSCITCGIRVLAPQPGSLQILTRRQGAGVGDGVNIEESISVGADYRGQRYSFEEAIFHTPGLHKFPGQSELYPAEYHVHMRTMSAPIRYITIVIPVSHMVQGVGSDYFAAMAAQPDPAATRPTLETLFTGSSKVIQYRGPDIRGRTGDVSSPDEVCSSSTERQFLMILEVAQIRATDLERIPREGSLSTDPRDLPAPGVAPAIAVVRDRLLKTAVLADPGILHGEKPTTQTQELSTSELECKPVKVVGGRDVVDIDGKTVDILKALGLSDEKSQPSTATTLLSYSTHIIMFIGTLLGLIITDFFFGKLWAVFFIKSPLLEQWEPLKLWVFVSISLAASGFAGGILGLVGL